MTNEQLAPILEKLADGQRKLDEGTAILERLNREKDECDAKCSQLKKDADECQRKKKETEEELQMNKLRLIRAHKLLGGLADEKARWKEEVQKFKYERN